MDAVRDPNIDVVVVMSSAQVGKTEMLLNMIGYHVHQDPCPMLLLQPTLEMAETFSKDRLAPMVRDTPVLTGRISDTKAKTSGNTIRHKIFPGGHITMAGANSPASLASRPIRIVLCDEVDRYPPSAGPEGDPVSLARKRSTTFWNRMLVMTSTPTIKGISRIEAAFEMSSQAYFHVPCPECGEYQRLVWSQVSWTDDNPETAVYACEQCGAAWSDAQRLAAIRIGEWRPTNAQASAAGFHLSELYSPWVALPEMVRNFTEAKALPETLKTWVNTALGETWEEDGITVDGMALADTRRETYRDVPERALVITAGVDVQKDRIECELVAWAPDMESWSLDYHVLHGDPTRQQVWIDLDEVLQSEFKHESGVGMHVAAACIDSGGHHTDEVYTFCRRRFSRRVYAIKGRGGHGLPLIVTSTRPTRRNARLFTIGVDSAKDKLYSRLKVPSPGPGYCHFPAHYDDEYFAQLTSEKAITKYVRGRPTIVWVKREGHGSRNEALDCRIYAMAALEILAPRWATLQQRIDEHDAPAPSDKPVLPRRPRARKNFVNRFRW